MKNFKIKGEYKPTALAMTGANIPPILPLVEHKPTAALLAGVGNKSDVKEKTVAKTQDMKNLPIIENVT